MLLTLLSVSALAATPYDSLSIQGYLRSVVGLPVSGTYNSRVTLYQNSAPCWHTGMTLVPITFTDGAFAKTLAGGLSSGACSGALGSSQFATPGPFTWTLAIDMDGDNTPDTTFTNIPITAVPFAMTAELVTGMVSSSQLSGSISPSLLGTGLAGPGTFLRGDGTWQNIASNGEANTASNVGSGAQVFKQKSGLDLQLRSLFAASSKISVLQNSNDIELDVNEASLSLANFAGTLSGSKISGGTIGAVNGANLSSLNASSLATGTVAPARLGSGTADPTTYLRGDGSWQVPSISGSQISGGVLGASDGSALTNLNASSLSSGTVPTAQLPIATAAAGGILTTGAQTVAGPKTFSGAFTLNAALSLSRGDVATAASITCLASTTSIVRLTGTVTTSLFGISPGADGQIIVVYTDGNVGTGLTVAHNSASGCANGRIFTNSNANLISTVASSTAAFVFVYNLASLRWHLISALQ